MNVKKILLITLIAVAVVASFSAVSAGLLDTLTDEGSPSNVIEIENITFNTTNATVFKYIGVDNEGWSDYVSKDRTRLFSIVNDSGLNDSQYDFEIDELKGYLAANMTAQKVNGVDVYTFNELENDTELYVAYVINDDLKSLVQFSSEDANETAYMASTLEFK